MRGYYATLQATIFVSTFPSFDLFLANMSFEFLDSYKNIIVHISIFVWNLLYHNFVVFTARSNVYLLLIVD